MTGSKQVPLWRPIRLSAPLLMDVGLRRTPIKGNPTSRESVWWSQAESNRRPLACHASALPTELWPLKGSPRNTCSDGRDQDLFVILVVATDFDIIGVGFSKLVVIVKIDVIIAEVKLVFIIIKDIVIIIIVDAVF